VNLKIELWLLILVLSFLLIGVKARQRGQAVPWVQILFFCSGFAALIYQIAWQRALFGIYGVNVESVTIVVSGFMLGLGLGSLIGGMLSRIAWLHLLVLFAVAEMGTAVFGVFSLGLFARVAAFTADYPLWKTGLVTFSLVVLPTVLMGATLPLLVAHLVRMRRKVGVAVSGLYFVNTLGSAAACFVAGDALIKQFGLSGSVRIAAGINAVVGVAVLVYGLTYGRKSGEVNAPESYSAGPSSGDRTGLLPFPLALACAAFAGFIALSYEIIWYRLLTFATVGIARAFAFLLGSYLSGVALGSRLTERHLERSDDNRTSAISLLGCALFASPLLSFVIGPAFALVKTHWAVFNLGGETLPAYMAFFPLICVGALLFGAKLPLISHVSVKTGRRAGAELSYLYAANIVGSTLGGFVVGFICTDRYSVETTSLLLLIGGLVFATLVMTSSGSPTLRYKAGIAVGLMVAWFAVAAARPLFATLYDRLLFSVTYPRLHLSQVVETRSGVVGVTPNEIVYGGGAYDGRFNVNLFHDVNLILRPYALSALHPAPRHVLMIGLGSGSWAQVVANNPEVQDLTVVEINPAYLQLLPQYAETASLLRNAKVKIAIDDGRRWLRHHDTKFDAIVMNTMIHWRDQSTTVLSIEFVELARKHLRKGGILFYNATGSADVLATGASAFLYALRFSTCLVVSDSPIVLDRERWKAVLLKYVIDGKPVVDTSSLAEMAQLERLVNIANDPAVGESYSIEDNDPLRRRLQGRRIITDDNMAVEW
jgi:hypothetical protein